MFERKWRRNNECSNESWIFNLAASGGGLFCCISIAMIFVELVVGPALRFVLYGEPYHFPSLSRLASTVLRC